MQYRTVRPAIPTRSETEARAALGDATLDDVEARVLACLVEKESTTPDYYPLTLNALTSACNQKSSRDPVVSYTEYTVSLALERLREKDLASLIRSSDGRVPRHRHSFLEGFQLNRREAAVLCVLMLRGPQTPGEIRQRSERIYAFESLAEVQEALDFLDRNEPRQLAATLPRTPGTKETRYAHLLSGESPAAAVSAPASPAEHKSEEAARSTGRVEDLESELQAVKAELQALRREFEAFRKNFE